MIGIFTERKIALSERKRSGHDVQTPLRVFLAFIDGVVAQHVAGF